MRRDDLGRPFRAWDFGADDPGRRSRTRFALGYHLAGFQRVFENWFSESEDIKGFLII